MAGDWSWDEVKRRAPQYLASITACLGGFALGCALGWSAPMNDILKHKYGFDDFNINIIGAALPIGAAMGVIIVPIIIDVIGRKRTMLLLVPPFVLGWILIAIAGSTIGLYVVGRLVTGACGGMFCVLAPIYVAEISEKEIRGMLGVFFQLLLVVGILCAYCSGFSENVVTISIICGVAPILFAVIMIFMPESPLFYMIKDKEESARKALRSFRGEDFDIEPEIKDFKALTTSEKLDLSVLKKRSIQKVLGIAYGLMAVQQLSGINAVIFYATSIFAEVGGDMDPLVQAVILGVIQVFGCLISAGLTDKLGRKLLMIASEALMCVCLLGLAIFFMIKQNDPENVGRFFWLPITSMSIFILAFCLGAGPLPWAYMGEIFPTNIKGLGSSSAAFLNWALAALVTISFSTVVNAVGTAAVFFFFSGICFLSVLFVLLFMIETKGKTFNEIQEELGLS